MLFYYHYGELQHIENFFRDGSIQIGTVRSYDEATHGIRIGDDEEGFSYSALTDEKVARMRAVGEYIPPHLGAWFGPGCSGNVVMTNNIGFNYAIFCVSRCIHASLCQDFKSSYEAAICIDRPFPFFAELTNAFAASYPEANVDFQHVADIHYQSRHVNGINDVIEAFIKSEDYAHQQETRAIWNVGENPPKFFRFKAPKAVRCCRPIMLKDMPTYGPHDSRDEALRQIQSAYHSGQSKGLS